MSKKKIVVIFLGMFMGCLTSVLLTGLFVYNRINLYEKMFEAPLMTGEQSQANVIYNLLAQADQSLKSGDPQNTINLLESVVETWESSIDQATAYQLLASAEMNLDHPEKSIEYAQKMTELSPGSFSYQMLAQAYDGTGDLANALNAYQQMMQFDDGDSRSDFIAASARILTLSQSLGTTTP